MRKNVLLAGLVAVIALLFQGCALPWEKASGGTPLPTATPPKVVEAPKKSPTIEGRLLYSRDGHIWLRTGTTENRLTEESPSIQPSWSPDGQQIVYVARGDGYSDLWVMNADGTNRHAITQNNSSYAEHSREAAHSSFWAFQPRWMPPTGEWIGYISHSPSGDRLTSTMLIWQIQPDGSNESRFLFAYSDMESPIWSPDGELVAFTLYDNTTGSQLRYYDPNSNSIVELGADQPGIERYDPAWSPDGLWVAYAARQDGQTDLWLMPSPLNPLYSQEWAPVRLTKMGAARAPGWSPTGKQIAFIAESNELFDLWLLNLDTTTGQAPQATGQEKLTDGGGVDANSAPSWAP